VRKNHCPVLLFAALLCTSVLADEPAGQSGADSAAKVNADQAIDTGGLKSGCFYAREVTNWDVLNREYLIAYAPSKTRAYLVRFSPPSFEVRSAPTIGFEGGERICGRPGDRLVVGRSRGMGHMIMDVWRLDDISVDRLLEKKKIRETGEVEPAKESPGAKVEIDIKGNGEPDKNEGAVTPDAD
jgi:hypothetical protein